MPLAAMKQLLERTHIGQKREDRFNDATLIPSAFFTQFEVVWHAVFATKPEVTQGNRLPSVTFKQRQKTVVAFVRGGPLPIDDTACPD